MIGWKSRVAFVAAILAVQAAVSAADVRGYGVFKIIDYVQTGPDAPVLQTGWGPYSFLALVQPNGPFTNQIANASVEAPTGFADPLLAPSQGSDLAFALSFPAETTPFLDTYYPAGPYTVRINTVHDGYRTLPLAMPSDSYPAGAPRIINYTEAQGIQPDQPFTLSWEPFQGGTAGDSIGFGLVDASDGTTVLRSAAFPPETGYQALDGTSTSILIPAGTLQRGRLYYGYLAFERDVVIDQTSYPGATGLVGFAKATSFAIATVPYLEVLPTAPDEFALRLHSAPGMSWIVQATTSLTEPDWLPLGTNSVTESYIDFPDPAGRSLGRRFYRAVQLP